MQIIQGGKFNVVPVGFTTLEFSKGHKRRLFVFITPLAHTEQVEKTGVTTHPRSFSVLVVFYARPKGRDFEGL
jgi:hypothetical protein